MCDRHPGLGSKNFDNDPHLASIWYNVNNLPIENIIQHKILTKRTRLWRICSFNFDRSMSSTWFRNWIIFRNKGRIPD
jgi:hypothetical protein